MTGSVHQKPCPTGLYFAVCVDLILKYSPQDDENALSISNISSSEEEIAGFPKEVGHFTQVRP